MPRGSPPATKSLRLLAAAGSLQQSRMAARKAAVDSPPPPVGPGAASGWRERTKGREKDGRRDRLLDGGMKEVREEVGRGGTPTLPVKLGMRVWRGEAEEQREAAASCIGRASRCFCARCPCTNTDANNNY